MTKKLLNGPDIVTTFQKMSCKRVSQSVTGRAFVQLGSAYRRAHSLLHDRFMKMMTFGHPIKRINSRSNARKHILPSPVP